MKYIRTKFDEFFEMLFFKTQTQIKVSELTLA